MYIPKTLSKRFICSEGGTGENRRIDPHLNVGILEKTIIIFGKNWFGSSPRLKIFSDPHLDKIRSALTGYTALVMGRVAKCRVRVGFGF